MPSTYELLTAADRFMLESGDLDPDAFDAALAAWLEESDDKLARIAAWHAALKARAIRDETQRRAFADAVDAAAKKMDRAEALAFEILKKRAELGEKPRVVGVARIQANGGRAPLLGLATVDAATLPDDLVVIRREPDPDAIRLALAAGREVPGVTVGARGSHVQFE